MKKATEVEQFQQEGYVGPFALKDLGHVRNLLNDRCVPTRLFTWYKATHEKSASVRRTSTAPEILEKLKLLLGPNILLWGSHFIGQKPGTEHKWHLDVEYGVCEGLTLWLGLKNLNDQTALSLITRSHLLNTVPQELKKLGVDLSNSEAVLKEAKKLDPKCELKTFYLKPGEFIIWSGKAWHGTQNHSKKTRHSIIFQYCTPENAPRMPLNYEYPDTKWAEKKPPCLLVAGVDNAKLNQLLPAEEPPRIGQLSRAYFKTRSFLGDVKYKLFQARQTS